MQQNTRDGITLDRCDDCTLTWFDRGELEQACENLPRPQGLGPMPPSALGPEALGESAHRCPRCNERTIRAGYVAAPLLRIDLCEQHGALVSDEQLHLLGQELVKAARPLGALPTPYGKLTLDPTDLADLADLADGPTDLLDLLDLILDLLDLIDVGRFILSLIRLLG